MIKEKSIFADTFLHDIMHSGKVILKVYLYTKKLKFLQEGKGTLGCFITLVPKFL